MRAAVPAGALCNGCRGLALMAGLVMLGTITGSYALSDVLASEIVLSEHPWFTPLLLCILAGCFTKSAQVPFHFWLPNAMAAPTPVSAFLHSATMVKAGVYLLARLSPAMGDSELWTLLLSLFGGMTMFLGAFMAITHTGAKKLLAYSTIMALGTLVMLIGIGTHYAMVAFATFLIAHSLYKGALFMIAGILDHETGTKDVSAMGAGPADADNSDFHGRGGPVVGCCSALLWFCGQGADVRGGSGCPGSWRAADRALGRGRVGVMVAAAVIAIKPFLASGVRRLNIPHEAPISMLAGPVVLASLSLLFGLALFIPEQALVGPVVASLGGAADRVHLSLWHGINVPLMLSGLSLVIALAIFAFWSRLQPSLAILRDFGGRFGPEAGGISASWNGSLRLLPGRPGCSRTGPWGTT